MWFTIGSLLTLFFQPLLPEKIQHEPLISEAFAIAAETDTLSRFTPIPPLFFSEGLPEIKVPDTLNRETLRWIGTLTPDQVAAMPDTVYIWEYKLRPGFEVTDTDSTLRWIQLLNLADRFYERPGAITYRTGMTGRPDALELHAYKTGDMMAELEGLKLNSLFTGQMNWNRIPVHKIESVEESAFSGSHITRIRLRDHYLVQPRTYLNFDESSHDYRSLEFSYTQNLRETTNLELSFWDRKDGTGYRRHKIEGTQILARVYHQLNENWLLRGSLMNNSRETEEPFGYVISEPSLFAFNRFTATPVESSASSESAYGDLYLQAHYRKNRDAGVSTIFGIHRQTESWNLNSAADSVAADFRKLELYAKQIVKAGPLDLRGDARLFSLSEREKRNFSRSSWFGSELSLAAETGVTPWLTLSLISSGSFINDGRNSSETGGKLALLLSERMKLSFFGGQQAASPDIQAAYWESGSYSGDEKLAQQRSLFAGGRGDFRLTPAVFTGFRADIRKRTDQIFLNREGEFISADPYHTYSASVWAGLNVSRFEGTLSGTYSIYSSESDLETNRMLTDAGDRIWLKGSFYWKNYLFDRATFVKAGLSGLFSPNPFRSAEYIVPLNRWQHASNEWVNPSYYRVDAEISARVRWMMVLLKWENVFNGAGQVGYFETTGYPMPERRFRFAIRVLFTN
ncbi:MAG: hypothetical protein EA360_07825 [Balneolaceae bacterium]|nr:MAG: hypothetical protein EA360_07825 [Balneolaceae bacterium]